MGNKHIKYLLSLTITIIVISSSSITVGLSFHTDTTYDDFNDGTITNLTLNGTELNSEFRLTKLISEWNKLNPSTKPSGMFYSKISDINGSSDVLLYQATGVSLKSETWVYNLTSNNWIKKSFVDIPNGRSYFGLASIYGTDKVIMFGGRITGTYTNETWEYDLSDNTWIKKNPLVTPVKRNRHTLVSIEGTDKLLLFGGYNSQNKEFNDTWIYDHSDNNWTKLNTTNAPERRSNHQLVQLMGTNKFLLYGGMKGSEYFGDTWIYDFDNNSWNKMNPKFSPKEKIEHSMGSIKTINDSKSILYGGLDSKLQLTDETWIYSLKNDDWMKIWPNPKPKMTSWSQMSSMINLKSSNRCLLLNHDGTFPAKKDLWTFSFNLTIKPNNGIYISSPLDSVINPDYRTLSWKSKEPAGTSLKFQLRSGSSVSELNTNNFIGPDGSSGTFYTTSPSSIWSGHDIFRYIQYKTFFNTQDINETPVLNEVLISFNCFPETTLTFPLDGNITASNKPEFSWDFTDIDGSQNSYQVLIDDDINFGSIDFDSGTQMGTNGFWQFPSGTGYTIIPDGVWYWKVRTKDNDGNWSSYTNPWKIKIDTTNPISNITSPINNGAYKNIDFIRGTSLDLINGTGIAKTEISIKRLSDNYYWNNTNWNLSEKWFEVNGTESWNFNSTNINWSTNTRYLINSISQDNVSNIENQKIGNTFLIDFTKPNSSIIKPKKSSFHNEIIEISGNASDINGSNIEHVEICIFNIEQLAYWNGTKWTLSESWLSTEGTNQWSFNSSNVYWYFQGEYEVYSRAIDKVKNIEIPSTGINFYIEQEEPISIIQSPNKEIYFRELPTISGTAYDNEGSGIDFVEVSIKRIIDDNYWDGKKFISEQYWLLANGTTSWYYDAKSVSLTSEYQYVIQSRAIDIAHNIESPSEGYYFYADLEPPVSEIKKPSNQSTSNNLEEISGKVYKGYGPGVPGVEICIKSVEDNNYWDGLTWNNLPHWHETDGYDSWRFDSSNVDWVTNTLYLISTRAFDMVGNVETQGDSNYFFFDDESPDNPSIWINNDDKYTNSESVTLTLDASDSGSGVSIMLIESDNSDSQDWVLFNSTKVYKLPQVDGIKMVYFKVKDFAGNPSVSDSDSIILDTTAPKSQFILINHGANETNVTTVTLDLEAFDKTSGLSEMSFSFDGINWDPWENYVISKNLILPGGDGTKYIYFRVKDNAGNVGESIFSEIILNTKKYDIDDQKEQPADDDKKEELENYEVSEDKEGILTQYLIISIIAIMIVLIIIIILLTIKRQQKFKKIEKLKNSKKRKPHPETIESPLQAYPQPVTIDITDTVTELGTEFVPQPQVSTPQTQHYEEQSPEYEQNDQVISEPEIMTDSQVESSEDNVTIDENHELKDTEISKENENVEKLFDFEEPDQSQDINDNNVSDKNIENLKNEKDYNKKNDK